MDRYLNNVCDIKVIGVGGAGNNAVNRMIEAGINSAYFVAVNTDQQVLNMSKADKTITLGRKITRGLGAGARPDVGRAAAEESAEEIRQMLEGSNLVFITCGLGGGTGTGAAPVIAEIAKSMGILTVGVVTKPFAFEGKIRLSNTEKGLEELKQHVDTLVIIPNEKLRQILKKDISLEDAFRYADEVLRQGIQGVSELIVKPSLINLDFADVSTIMKDKGLAHMGIGRGRGEYKTMEAVRQAVTSQLLETSIEGATGILINITGGRDLSLGEIYEAVDLVRDVVDSDCNIIFGATIDENIKDQVQVTVIATGFDCKGKETAPQPQTSQTFSAFPKNVIKQEEEESEDELDDDDENEEYEEDIDEENNEEDDEEDEEEELEETEEEEEEENKPQNSNDFNFNSHIDLGDTSIPPFLRKLKK